MSSPDGPRPIATLAVAQTTTETIWLPSYHEVFGSTTTGETASMIKYNVLFRDAESRKKFKVGTSSATYWWLRSAINYDYIYAVNSGGYNFYYNANYTYAVCPSFCT